MQRSKVVVHVLGTAPADTTDDGAWTTSESLRVWAISHDGHLLGSGWRSQDSE